MVWLIVIIGVLIIVAAILFVQFFNVVFRGFAPFISTKPKVISKIMENLDFSGNSKVYELGCGKAGFLRAIESEYPKAELIGIEYSFWLWLITEIQIGLNKSKINIKRENFFKINLADADLIYCYLNSRAMKELQKKFRRECKKGTKIISYIFSIPNLKPDKIISVKNNEKIYFYTV